MKKQFIEGTCFASREFTFIEKDNAIVKIVNKNEADFNI